MIENEAKTEEQKQKTTLTIPMEATMNSKTKIKLKRNLVVATFVGSLAIGQSAQADAISDANEAIQKIGRASCRERVLRLV